MKKNKNIEYQKLDENWEPIEQAMARTGLTKNFIYSKTKVNKNTGKPEWSNGYVVLKIGRKIAMLNLAHLYEYGLRSN